MWTHNERSDRSVTGMIVVAIGLLVLIGVGAGVLITYGCMTYTVRVEKTQKD